VLGSGVDVIYPPENRRLAGDIASHGAVVSQFEPGTRPYSGNFPARNRVIAGLSLGVVVVEAAEKSGSLITAGLAGDLGREVMAVPGLLTSTQSVGAHRLIQDGAALIQGWEDVVGLLPLHWRDQVKVTPAGAMTPTATTDTTKALPAMTTTAMAGSTIYGTAMDATTADTHTCGPNHLAHGQHAEGHVGDKLDQYRLLQLIGEAPADIDGIIERSGLTPGRASALLVSLEVEGRIRQLEGKRFVQVSLG
jgi:DNA processing protein